MTLKKPKKILSGVQLSITFFGHAVVTVSDLENDPVFRNGKLGTQKLKVEDGTSLIHPKRE